MHEALYYTRLKDNVVKCTLCPWNCVITSGQTGICKVRTNVQGQLNTTVYNRVAALGVDPIEKKPLYHFHPGKNILSIGEVGCNLHCNFCQNHRISQCKASDFKGFQDITSEKIVSEALKTWNNIGIAYTYNEPVTFYEFMLDTAKLAQQKGLKNVVVSNGYIKPEPLIEILPFIDAFNIDLKAFNDDFYKKQTKGTLKPVLDALKIIAKNEVHLELTNLVIPSLNDNILEFEKMAIWISKELGKDVPLHISRYFPQFKIDLPPTPVKTLESFYTIAKKYLNHVYLGNISDNQRSSTFCAACNEMLLNRNRYEMQFEKITEEGFCKKCGNSSNIVF